MAASCRRCRSSLPGARWCSTPPTRRGDILADTQLKLHTPGTSYPIKWVTIHTANKDDPASMSFDANAAAKAAGATPFKRPENTAWLPGSDFRTFYFTATGDTECAHQQRPELAAAAPGLDLPRRPARQGRP